MRNPIVKQCLVEIHGAAKNRCGHYGWDSIYIEVDSKTS